MAQKPDAQLKLNETELDALMRVIKPKLFRHMTENTGPYRSRTLINGGNNYAGFREYVPGDEVRTINWRASARSRQFQVRQQQQEKSGRWYICLDASASMGLPGPDKWRLARQIAEAFAYILLTCGHQLGLVVFSDKVHDYYPLGVSRIQYKKIHQVLLNASPEAQGGDSLLHTCMPFIKQQASVIVISDFLQTDLLKHGLDKIRKAGHFIHALRILAENETNLAATGTLVLADVETNNTLQVEATERTDQRAEAILRQQNKELAAYCQEHRFNYSFATSDLHWKSVILNHVSHL